MLSRLASEEDPLPTPLSMTIEKYNPSAMYGFASGGEHRVFFHLDVFDRGRWDGIDMPPPPIVGEEVLVEFSDKDAPEGKEPRARKVTRVIRPLRIKGIVDTFDVRKGWGFAIGEDGRSYFLHRSEVKDHLIPIKGTSCVFTAGFKKGRPRACYVQLENG